MDQEKIGKFIASQRKKKNLTQEDFANILGVSSKTISRWETGSSMPDLAMLPILSKELDITINDLLSGEFVSKKDYQEKFEENVVSVVSRYEKKNKIIRVILSIYLSICILILGIVFTNYIYNNEFFLQKYNEIGMKLEKEENNTFDFLAYYGGRIRYFITKYNNKEVVFINYYSSLEDLKYKKDASYDLNSDRHLGFVYNFDLANSSNDFQIYYTNTNIKKIKRLKENELGKVIKNSYLLYENK